MKNDRNSFEKGFVIIDTDDMNLLNVLKKDIFRMTQAIFNIPDVDVNEGFNNFHQYIASYSPTEINAKRIDLISQISAQIDVSEIIFKAFESSIVGLIGPDVLAQKGCNLVLQPPKDQNPSELHRDAPANSPYEIVAWVPLVDCYKTKSMYVLDSESTNKAFDILEKNPTDWEGFENYSKSIAIFPDVPFGKALIFFTGLLHGSEINIENETRVSLNMRYKSLFSPSGLKNQLQFFKPIRVSNLVKLGGKLEVKELLK